MENKISIAEGFSRTPGARYYKDGPNSGEKFFKEVLKPDFEKSLRENKILLIDLDGTEGYATSFLDEAFRSLSDEFGAETVWENIKLISQEEPDWIDEIHSYIFKL